MQMSVLDGSETNVVGVNIPLARCYILLTQDDVFCELEPWNVEAKLSPL